MEDYDWAHLAFHAHQNDADPVDSWLSLYYGKLGLKKIIQKYLKSKELSFLPACQTAKGVETSGMLMAGYQSVIATMWAVHDEDAPLVADRVYGRLLTDGKMDQRGSARALHEIVKKLRQKAGDKPFTHWVLYIPIGA